MNYKPLRITAYLQTPVVSDATLPLDGILLYLTIREKFGFEVATLPQVPAKILDCRAPFDKYYRQLNGKNFWFYKCSFARWVGTTTENTDFWVKRFDEKYADIIDFKNRRGRIETKSGYFKGYRMPVFTRHALAVRWYAVGDMAEIKRLLPFCRSLGKKRSQGYGEVLRWEVESWHSDWSVYSPSGLMRAVPNEKGIVCGLRPPYWSPESQTICRLPNNFIDVP